MTVHTAMILAAGRGERMRPLTDSTPKPLLKAGGKRLIEWQIEGLVTAGVQRIVINHAWLGDAFGAALGNGERYGCELIYSPETSALETAGGIAHALPQLGNAPFIVVSGDIYTDFKYQTLPNDLNGNIAHLVLVNNPEYNPSGDMGLMDGLIHVLADRKLTYANIGVFSAAPFQALNPNAKQKLFPWLYEQGNISGEYSTATWHNVGTPQQLNELNTALSTNVDRIHLSINNDPHDRIR
jgi:N-acetyl-alpha-D-muramate 1-phosphate uridylyltransferase